MTLAHGRHDHLARQHASLARGTVLPDHYVVVAMDDPEFAAWRPAAAPYPHVVPIAAEPLGLPLAAARNHGVRTALDLGADVVICLDVDCLAGPALVEEYADLVETQPDVLWSGPVTYLDPPPTDGYDLDGLQLVDAPHPARPAPEPGETVLDGNPDLFWSLSFGVHRNLWTRTGGFCEDYVGYGGEDTDFGHLAVAAGARLGWAGGPRAYHQHHPTEDPPVQHVDDILRNGAIFHERWGRWPMSGWLEEFERLGLVVRDGDGWRAPDGTLEE